jgi:hypothetical protein
VLDDTTPAIREMQRRIHQEMGGFGRIACVARMFAGRVRMIALKVDDPAQLMRRIHGLAISEADYAAISQLLAGQNAQLKEPSKRFPRLYT